MMHLRMYVCMYVCMYAYRGGHHSTHEVFSSSFCGCGEASRVLLYYSEEETIGSCLSCFSKYVLTFVCLYVCMYVCMYVLRSVTKSLSYLMGHVFL